MASSIDPSIWGPPFWAAIHLMCLAAPKAFDATTETGYRQFFTSLPHVLPCKKCREHLAANLAALPMDGAFARGRDSLFEWSVHLHNRVNVANGKAEMAVSDARNLWMAVARGTVTFMEMDAAGAGAGAGAGGGVGGAAGRASSRIKKNWAFLVVGFGLGALIVYLAMRPASASASSTSYQSARRRT